MSSGSDYALISLPPKSLKLATTPRKRPTSSARGKTLTKVRATHIGNEDLAATDALFAIPPSNMITGNNILLGNLKRAGYMTRLA